MSAADFVVREISKLRYNKITMWSTPG